MWGGKKKKKEREKEWRRMLSQTFGMREREEEERERNSSGTKECTFLHVGEYQGDGRNIRIEKSGGKVKKRG